MTFLVCHNDVNDYVASPNTTPFSYSYTSEGTAINKPMELAYDTSEPTGILSLTAGDSVAVVFDGMPGTILDSIKVALRQAGSVYGGIFQAASSGSFLGTKKLAVPITVTSTIASRPPVPYPVPWNNWVKLDLKSRNIDATNNFVVEFVIEGDYPATNRVMVTDYLSSSAYHSHFYQSSASKWVYYTDSGNPGNIFLNLIRAYVSLPTGVNEVIELLPSSFNISQNYPNPFNPSTVISYTLPKSGNVEIKIYDSLGKEVRSLINEEKKAGRYNIMWDSRDNYGGRVSSGIYFYTIRSGSFAETKKMVLLK